MTLAVSRAVPHFAWRHTGASDRHMRYVSTCVGARVVGVKIRWTKAIRCGACYYSIVVNAHRVTSMADTDIDAVRKQKKTEVYTYSCYAYNFYAYRFTLLTCDMYMSDLRHTSIHDPLLSSLKMEGTRLLFFSCLRVSCNHRSSRFRIGTVGIYFARCFSTTWE
jgi:hypothetical protein